MKRKHIFYYSLLLGALACLPLGIFLRSIEAVGAKAIFTLSLLFINLYLVYKLIKAVADPERSAVKILFLSSLALTPITLFSRYLYYPFWDYPGIAVVLVFLTLLGPVIFSKKSATDYKIASISIVFLILIVPLSGIPDFHKSPRRLIPKEWYNRYDVGNNIPIALPWYLTSDQAVLCSKKAKALGNSGQTEEAIEAYRQCLFIEKSPRFYFELSQLHAFNNELELAIELMDSVVYLDNTHAPSYSNRGLLYYKLKRNDEAIADFNRAIELDSGAASFYVNLGLALYFEDRFEEACLNFNKAEMMGSNPDKFVRRIRNLSCKTSTPP